MKKISKKEVSESKKSQLPAILYIELLYMRKDENEAIRQDAWVENDASGCKHARMFFE